MNENAIYNAKLLEIEGNLKQLKEINIETINIEKIIENIKQELQKEIEECYKKYNENIFLNDSIATVYRSAIAKLEKINQSLIGEYQEFYILNQTLLELKSKKITENTVEEIVKETINLLNKVLLSNYYVANNEKLLLELYNFTYNLIKFEMIYNNNSILLDYVKTEQVHTSYVTKCIKEELEELSKNNKKQIQEILVYINKNGLDDIYYLNPKLLFLIIKSDKKEYMSIIEDRLESFYKEYNEIKKDLESVKEKSLLHIKEIKDTKKKRKQLWRKQLSRKALFFLNLGIVSLSCVTAAKIADKVPPNKEYKTITTYYDSSDPNHKEEKIAYQKETTNELTLTEYSPWESPGYFREDFQRNVYEYTVSNLEEYSENIEDYLTEELKENISLENISLETSIEPPTETYTQNKYVIHQIYQNKEDYKEEEDKIGKWVLRIILIGAIFFIDGLIYMAYFSKRKKIKEERKETKKVLLNQKKLLLEEKTKMSTLTEELNSLKTKLNQQYDTLPEVLREDEKIQRRIRQLNEIENED